MFLSLPLALRRFVLNAFIVTSFTVASANSFAEGDAPAAPPSEGSQDATPQDDNPTTDPAAEEDSSTELTIGEILDNLDNPITNGGSLFAPTDPNAEEGEDTETTRKKKLQDALRAITGSEGYSLTPSAVSTFKGVLGNLASAASSLMSSYSSNSSSYSGGGGGGGSAGGGGFGGFGGGGGSYAPQSMSMGDMGTMAAEPGGGFPVGPTLLLRDPYTLTGNFFLNHADTPWSGAYYSMDGVTPPLTGDGGNLRGAGLYSMTVIGGGTNAPFLFLDGQTLNIEGFTSITISNLASTSTLRSGAITANARLRIRDNLGDVTFLNNISTGSSDPLAAAGAIFASSSAGMLVVNNAGIVSFIGNTYSHATQAGAGAIYFERATLDMTNNGGMQFLGNIGANGGAGAIYCSTYATASILRIAGTKGDVIFAGNMASAASMGVRQALAIDTADLAALAGNAIQFYDANLFGATSLNNHTGSAVGVTTGTIIFSGKTYYTTAEAQVKGAAVSYAGQGAAALTTFASTLRLYGGTMEIEGGARVAVTTAFTVDAGTTLSFGLDSVYTSQYALTVGSLAAGTITLNVYDMSVGNTTYNLISSTTDFAGITFVLNAASQANGVLVIGANTVQFISASTFTINDLSVGILAFNSNRSVSDATRTFRVDQASTFNNNIVGWNASSALVTATTGGDVLIESLTGAQNLTFDGINSENGAALSTTGTAGAAYRNLGALTFANTRLDFDSTGGLLFVNNSSLAFNNAPINMSGAGALTIAGTVGNVAFTSTGKGINQTGAGAVKLAALAGTSITFSTANTFTGAVTLNGTTDGANSTVTTGTIAFNNGKVSTFANNLALAGGTLSLSEGASLAVTGAFTLATGSTLELNLTSASTLISAGSWNATGTINLNLSFDSTFTSTSSFTLFSSTAPAFVQFHLSAPSGWSGVWDAGNYVLSFYGLINDTTEGIALFEANNHITTGNSRDLLVDRVSAFTATNLTWWNDTSSAITVDAGGTLNLSSLNQANFSFQGSTGPHASLWNVGGTMNVAGAGVITVSDVVASTKGAVANVTGTLSMTTNFGLNFLNNSTTEEGGAIYLGAAANLIISANLGDVIFAGNTQGVGNTRLAIVQAIGATGTVQFSALAGRSIQFYDGNTFTGAIALNGSSANPTTGTILFSGVAFSSDFGTSTAAGADAITTFGGAVSLWGGTLHADAHARVLFNAGLNLAASTTLSVTNSAVASLAGSLSLSTGNVANINTAGIMSVSAGLTMQNNSIVNLATAGQLSVTGAVSMADASVLNLTASTMSVGTGMTLAGTSALNISSASSQLTVGTTLALGDTSKVTVSSAGKLIVTGALTMTSGSVLNASAAPAAANNITATSVAMSGTSALNLSNSGKMAVTGNMTMSDTAKTKVSSSAQMTVGGNLTVQTGSALTLDTKGKMSVTGTLTLESGGTLNLASAGVLTVTGAVTLYGGSTVNIALSDLYTSSAPIFTADNLNFAGTGTVALNIDVSQLEKWVYQTEFVLFHADNNPLTTNFTVSTIGGTQQSITWVANGSEWDLVFKFNVTAVTICDTDIISGHIGHITNLSLNKAVAANLRLQLDASSLFTQANCNWWNTSTSLVTHTGGQLVWESLGSNKFNLEIGGAVRPGTQQLSAISSSATVAGSEIIFRNLNNLTFQNLNASNGSAIYVSGTADVYLSGLSGAIKFLNNSATEGGAIYSSKGSVYITDNNAPILVQNNSSITQGGAIMIGVLNNQTTATSGSLVISRNANISFINNQSGSTESNGGAAIYINGLLGSQSRVEISENLGDLLFSGNHTTANGKGGVILAIGYSSVLIMDNNGEVDFSYNFSHHEGGAIAMGSGATADSATGGSLVISGNLGDVTFKGNSASNASTNGGNGGGAIWFNGRMGSVVEISNNLSVLFENNRAINVGRGGAIFVRGSASLNINNNDGSIVFKGNSSFNEGGAIAAFDTATVNIFNNTGTVLFESNFASNPGGGPSGGAIYLDGATSLSIRDNSGEIVFLENSSDVYNGGTPTAGSYHGGAIRARNGSITISGNESILFDRNIGGNGGAIYVGTGGLYINNNRGIVKFVDNKVLQHGGALAAAGNISGKDYGIDVSGNSDPGLVATILFENNVAGGYGGVIFGGNVDGVLDAPTAAGVRIATNLGGVEFVNNTAGMGGGAIFAYAGTITISENASAGESAQGRVLFKGNKTTGYNPVSTAYAAANGGAIYGTKMNILNNEGAVSFESNFAYGNGGAIFLASTTGTGAIKAVLNISGNTGEVSFVGNTAGVEWVVDVDNPAGAYKLIDGGLATGAGANSWGGAILLEGGDLNISGNTLLGRTGTDIVTFSGNIVGNHGGAIAIFTETGRARTATFALSGNVGNVLFSNNHAVGFAGQLSNGTYIGVGGAIDARDLVSFVIGGYGTGNGSVTFQGNTAYAGAGAIWVAATNAEISYNTSVLFDNNRVEGEQAAATLGAKSGGAIISFSDNFDVKHNADITFSNNYATDVGGAIYVNKTRPGVGVITPNLSIKNNEDVTFSHNVARYGNGNVAKLGNIPINAGGGAIFFDSAGTLSLTNNTGNVTFSGNLAGAIYESYQEEEENEEGDKVLVTKYRIMPNDPAMAAVDGGAVYLCTATMIVSGNSGVFLDKNFASGSGGAIFLSSSTAKLNIIGNIGVISFTGNTAGVEWNSVAGKYKLIGGGVGAASSGGAIAVSDGKLTISDNDNVDKGDAVVFDGNIVGNRGGAISLTSTGLDGFGKVIRTAELLISGNFGDVFFKNNQAIGFTGTLDGAYIGVGGAIDARDVNYFKIVNNAGTVLFENNSAYAGAGAMWVAATLAEIRGNEAVTFAGNRVEGADATVRAGGAVITFSEAFVITQNANILFSENFAADIGGALYSTQYRPGQTATPITTNISITQNENVLFEKNVARYGNGNKDSEKNVNLAANAGGGAIFFDSTAANKDEKILQGKLAISNNIGNVTFSGNLAGAIYESYQEEEENEEGDKVLVTKYRILPNDPAMPTVDGGAVYVSTGTMEIFANTVVTFDSNFASGSGGAIYAKYATAEVLIKDNKVGVDFIRNTAGVVWNDETKKYDPFGDTSRGGAIAVDGGKLEISNNIGVQGGEVITTDYALYFYQNAASYRGGAISIFTDEYGISVFTRTAALVINANLGDIVFEENHAIGHEVGTAGALNIGAGGAIDARDLKDFAISGNMGNVIFKNNSANSSAGAIWVAATTASITGNENVSFIGNKTTGVPTLVNTGVKVGGAITSYSKKFDISGNKDISFTGNSATDLGGAIFVSAFRNGFTKLNEDTEQYDELQNVNLTISDNTGSILFEKNVAQYGNSAVGGGLKNYYFSAHAGGGAIYFDSLATGTLAISGNMGNVSFTGNLAGAIYDAGGKVVVNTGVPTVDGGAVYMATGTMEIVANANISFIDNFASGSGGAIYLSKGAILDVSQNDNITIAGNSAGVNGGAIYLDGDTSLAFSKNDNGNFSNNHATLGGFAYAAAGSSMSWDGTDTSATTDMTVFNDNYATGSGGAFYAAGDAIEAVTILVLNKGSIGFYDNMAGWNGTAFNGVVAHGGAMYLINTILTIETSKDVIFQNNAASGSGGAVYVANLYNAEGEATARFIITGNQGDVAFYDNTAGVVWNATDSKYNLIGGSGDSSRGGAIAMEGGELEFSWNSFLSEGDNEIAVIFEGNIVGNRGGAISIFTDRVASGGVNTASLLISKNTGDVIFRNNHAIGRAGTDASGGFIGVGGAIDARDLASFVIGGVGAENDGHIIFENNTAYASAGALWIAADKAEISYNKDVKFIGNKTTGETAGINGSVKVGGAILSFSNDFKIDINVTVAFDGNYATDLGGAIYVTKNRPGFALDPKLSISNNSGDVSFTNNAAQFGNGNTGALKSTTIAANAGGGAIYFDSTLAGKLTIAGNTGNVIFAGNLAGGYYNGSTAVMNTGLPTVDGGAVYMATTKMEIKDNKDILFSANQASGSGGAIYLGNSATLDVLRNGEVEFKNNVAGLYGGAIYLSEKATITFMENTLGLFQGNRAFDGGVIYAVAGSSILWVGRGTGVATANTTTIMNNSATGSGGAIYASGDFTGGAVSVSFTDKNIITFTGNTAGADGGAIYLVNTNLTIAGNNTIKFLSNTAGADGGAIYEAISGLTTNTIVITGNEWVVFAGNTSGAGKREAIVQLDATTTVVLSAEAGHTIEFYDGNRFAGAVELGTAADAGRTMIFTEADAPAAVGAGAVIFSGAAFDTYDAAGVKGTELRSSFSNTVKLLSGELQVWDYAEVKVKTAGKEFTAEADTKTTLGNGILSVVKDSTMKSGSTLAFMWGSDNESGDGAIKGGPGAGIKRSDSQFRATGGGTVNVNGLITATIVLADMIGYGSYSDPTKEVFVSAMGTPTTSPWHKVNETQVLSTDYIAVYDISHYFAIDAMQGSKIDLTGSIYTVTLDGSFTFDLSKWFSGESKSGDLVIGDRIRVQIVDGHFVTTANSTLNFAADVPWGWITENYWNSTNSGINSGYIDFVYIPEPSTATLGMLGLASLLLRRRRSQNRLGERSGKTGNAPRPGR